MPQRWSVDEVLAMAPNPAVRNAARKLSPPEVWDDRGANDVLVWGVCAGSGARSYRAAVDLAGPEFHCSCPARTAPCKHVLALMLGWADGEVASADPAEFATQWQARAARRASARAEEQRREAAAARSVANRARRVDKAFGFLGQWFDEQLRAGLARTDGAQIESIAGRLDAAKLPGVAARLRALDVDPGPAVAADRPARLLAGFANLHALGRAHAALGTLDPERAASVRRYTDHPVDEADAFATQPVDDRWLVLGLTVTELSPQVRREVALLRGRRTKRLARLVAVDNGRNDASLQFGVGSVAVGKLYFHPAPVPLEAELGPWGAQRVADTRPPPASTLVAMTDEWARLLEKDPWLPLWPAVVHARPVLDDGRWWLADEDSRAVPFDHDDPWRLAVAAGDRPVTIAGYWNGAALRPTAAWIPGLADGSVFRL